MKKILITAIATLIVGSSFAQQAVKLGIKVSPSLAWNRVTVPKGNPTEWNGVAFRFGAGAFLDFMFSDNYALSTGVNYTTKGSGIEYTDINSDGDEYTGKPDYSLQYIEIPIALKLFTNDIADDIKLYFQVGSSLNLNLSASVDDEKSYTNNEGKIIDYKEHFSFFDVGLLLSSGIEMQMAEKTYLVLGVTYNRGLMDADSGFKDDKTKKGISPTGHELPLGYILKNDYVSIDIGLKF